MHGFLAVIPVGPAAPEHGRALALLESLRAHEPGAAVVVVDDLPAGIRRWPDGVTVLENPRRGRGIGTLGGTCTATLAALAHAHAAHPGAWVLRLDTDALVIGPVAARVEEAWRPADGILGSCRVTCNGHRRDVRGWTREVERHARGVWAWRRPPRRPWYVRAAEPHVRSVLRAALAAGYLPGEHCVAAGCAISAPMIAALAARGYLDAPERWLAARLGDDIMLGAMAGALGLDLRDLPSVFGLQHIGLPDSPAGCVERGFAVVHSLKNDPDLSERDARRAFAGVAR